MVVPVILEAAVLAVEAAEGIILANEAAGAIAVGEAAGTAATAGRLGASLGTATNTIALGRNSGVLTQAAGAVGGNALFDIAKWAWNTVTGQAQENQAKFLHEACFGTFDVRAKKTRIEDNYTVNYPHQELSLNNTYDLSTAKANGERVNSARVIGFWGVHVRILEYDEKKLSAWRHPLDRRNFGTIAFCRRDVPFQEASIHFTEHLILCPMVRALAADAVLGDMSQAVANRVHGNLAPGVKAEISFLPVYETYTYSWTKSKPP